MKTRLAGQPAATGDSRLPAVGEEMSVMVTRYVFTEVDDGGLAV